MPTPPSKNPGGRPISDQVWIRSDTPLPKSPTAAEALRRMLEETRAKAAAKSTPAGTVGTSWMGPMYQMAVQHLQQPVAALFDPTPEQRALLRESALDQLPMDVAAAWRDARLRRSLIQQTLFDRLRRQVSAFARPATVHSHPPKNTAGQTKDATPGWGLMDDRHLDEHLAIQRQIDLARQHCKAGLSGIQARLSWLRGVEDIDPVDNPLDPQDIIQTLADSLSEDWPTEVRLGILARMEHFIQPCLPGLYLAWDKLLAEQGMAPEWSLMQARQAEIERAGRHRESGGGRAESSEKAADFGRISSGREVGALADELKKLLARSGGSETGKRRTGGPQAQAWKALRQLIDSSRKTDEIGAQEGAVSTHHPVLGELMLPDWMVALEKQHRESITVDDQALLLVLDWMDTHRPVPPESTASNAEALKKMVRQRIMEQHSNNDDPNAGLKTAEIHFGEHEAAIDAVGWLFEFVLSDVQIPEGVRLLIARLQLPFVRLAVMEPDLFAQPDHAARRLLNGLAELSQGWDSQGERARQAQELIRTTVGTVLADHAHRPDVMAEQAERIEVALVEQQARAAMSERLLTESMAGKERLDLARSQVTQTFDTLLSGGPNLPDWLHRLTTQFWAHHAMLQLARHGEDSDGYQQSLAWVRQLLRAAHPQLTPEMRSEIHLALPAMVQHMQDGLATVNLPEQDRTRLGHQLTNFIQSQLDPRRQVEVDHRLTDQLDTMQTWAQPVARPDQAHLMVTHSVEAREFMDGLRIGHWLVFHNEQEQVDRGKVAWISSARDRVLLVNAWGAKRAEIAMRELGMQFDMGKAKAFSEQPVFERAMANIVKRLNKTAPDNPHSADPKDWHSTSEPVTDDADGEVGRSTDPDDLNRP